MKTKWKVPANRPTLVKVVKNRRKTKTNPLGGMTCLRKCGLFQLRNQIISGSAIVQNAVNSCLVTGAPEPCFYANSNIYNVPFAMQFSLSQVLNPLEFSSLFDRYKITGVKISIKYNANSESGVAPFTAQPAINWVPDYDGVDAVTVAALRQRQGIKRKVFNDNRLVKMSVSPRLSGLTFNTGLSNGYSIEPPKWLDCDYRDIPHFGIKGYFEDMNLASSSTIDTMFIFDVTLKLQFKDLQ